MLGAGARTMSDIFLSYASADLPRVGVLIRALERHGWSVWWDRTILPGRTFDQVIEEALDAAHCVVVVWSQHSVNSDWVKTEAAKGARRRILVPVLLDEVRIPLEFRRMQAARLLDWHDTGPHPEFDKVVQAITALLGPPSQQTAPASVSVAPMRPPQPPPAVRDYPSRLVNSLGMTFARVPAGEFRMGSTDGFAAQQPVHTVRISQPFYLGVHTVTQGQWE